MINEAAERIVVGMSGGVDSSVAAALLVEQGYDVVGITMRVWPWQAATEATKRFGSCCGTEATDDARAVARALGVPHYLLNMEDEFDREVISPFAADYAQGRTPVPCVACNSSLKFGSLLGRARAWEATAVATGHYARVARDPRRAAICSCGRKTGARIKPIFSGRSLRSSSPRPASRWVSSQRTR